MNAVVLFDAAQAAGYLGVELAEFRRLCAGEGGPPFHRLAHGLRFEESQLARWLEDATAPTQRPTTREDWIEESSNRSAASAA